MKKRIFFDWGMSDHSGWGIYGFNFLIHASLSSSYLPLPVSPSNFIYPVDPMADRQLKLVVAECTDSSPKDGDYWLNSYCDGRLKSYKRKLIQVGVTFFESNPLSEVEISNLKKYRCIIAGSSWNQSILRNHEIDARLVLQGIDSDLFRFKTKKFLKNNFVVFSGGKLELRKSQDLVVKAFSIFARNHKDALLISAWRSPFEKNILHTINASNVCKPIYAKSDINQSFLDWVKENGISLDQYIGLDAVPNRLMPEVLREADVAVFPSRCEGGTNLVAMEALSFGLTCIISNNTGHEDIIRGNNCIPLNDQRHVRLNGLRTEGWGESSVDEIVAALEDVYFGRKKLDPISVSASIAHLTWDNATKNLLRELETLSDEGQSGRPPVADLGH